MGLLKIMLQVVENILNGLILAKYLGIDFIDAKDVIKFNKYGTLDSEATKLKLKNAFSM